MSGEKYTIYAYHAGERKGERFYAPVNAKIDETEPNLMKYIKGVPLEIAERICNNGKQDMEELLMISTFLLMIRD